MGDKRDTSADSSRQQPSILVQIALLIMLLVRGVLLWIVVPVAAVWWLIAIPVDAIVRKPYVGLGQTIGWADLNLIALLTLGHSAPFVSWSQASKVKHRVSIIDPA